MVKLSPPSQKAEHAAAKKQYEKQSRGLRLPGKPSGWYPPKRLFPNDVTPPSQEEAHRAGKTPFTTNVGFTTNGNFPRVLKFT